MSNQQPPTTDPFILAWNSIRYHTHNLMDEADKHFDSIATSLRQKANETHVTDWIPHISKKHPPPPPPVPVAVKYSPRGTGAVWEWLKNHKWLIAGIAIVAVGGGIYVVKRRRREKGKRRKALKAANGARKEVVVIHGQPHDPLLKSTAQDLERRGFIVYVAVSSHDDEQIVLNEGKADIKPLQIDILDNLSAQSSVSRFVNHLRSPITPFPGAPPHHLRLTSVILISDTSYPSGPIETIPLDHWSDTFNLKLIQTLAITQLFLPAIVEFKARILIITPSIPYSLRLPFHAPEVATVGALEGIVGCLRREVEYTGAEVVWIRTGTLDSGVNRANSAQASRADVLSWSPAVRSVYARGYVNAKAVGDVRGSSLKELNQAVVSSMLDKKFRKTVYVGSGSVAYEMIARILPGSVVGWMLGLQGGRRITEAVRGVTASPPGSRGSSGGDRSLENSVEWERL